jgi:protein-disulfide isomerase
MRRIFHVMTISGLLAAAVVIAPSVSAQAQRTAPSPASAPKSAPKGPTLTLDRERALGKGTAPIVVVEFGDYQCAACRLFHLQVLPEFKKKYIDTGVVRYYHKDYPDVNNSQALRAAIAAYCAGRQGKFSAMNQRLYEEQERLGDVLYQELAKELQLDYSRFDDCRWNDASPKVMARDIAEAELFEVSSTPTLLMGRFIDGRMVVEHVRRGGTTLDLLAQDIEDLRAKQKQ